MATEVRSFAVTIPANTAQAAPVTVDTSFPPMEVQAVRWKVPPGPSGLMGWQLTVGGHQVIPLNLGAWIVADDDGDTWQIESLPDSGAWSVTGYNTDIYDHAVYLDFLLAPLGTAAPSGAAATPAPDALTAAVLGLSAG